ncbi:hypothetical protein LTS08_002514 [Lithohypha guttulata]|nr:hypothetical protein LTS08_002514 [Lithohypha guttulata]
MDHKKLEASEFYTNMRQTCSILIEYARCRDFTPEFAIKQIDSYCMDLEELLRNSSLEPTLRTFISTDDLSTLEQSLRQIEELWQSRIVEYLQERIGELAQRVHSGSFSIGTEVEFSLLGRQLARVQARQRVHGWNVDSEDWERFTPQFLHDEVNVLAHQLLTLHNQYQESLYLNTVEEEPSLFYLIWKNLRRAFEVFQQSTDGHENVNYPLESEFFQIPFVRFCLEWICHPAQPDFYVPEEIEIMVACYCQFIFDHGEQAETRSLGLDGLNTNLPLTRGAIEALMLFPTEREWNANAARALHEAVLRLNYLTYGPMVYRRHEFWTDYWWVKAHLDDSILEKLRLDRNEEVVFEHKQRSLVRQLPSFEENEAGRFTKTAPVFVEDTDSSSSEASNDMFSQRYDTFYGGNYLLGMADESFRDTPTLTSHTAAPVVDDDGQVRMFGGEGRLPSSDRSVSMSISDGPSPTVGASIHGVDGLHSESMHRPEDASSSQGPLLVGRNITSKYDYVYYPWPDNRASEVANDRLVTRDLSNPSIYSEGLKVRDLVNLPPRHCRKPGSYTVYDYQKRKTFGPLDCLNICRKVISYLIFGDTQPQTTILAPPHIVSRASGRHYKHSKALMAKHDTRRRVSKA